MEIAPLGSNPDPARPAVNRTARTPPSTPSAPVWGAHPASFRPPARQTLHARLPSGPTATGHVDHVVTRDRRHSQDEAVLVHAYPGDVAAVRTVIDIELPTSPQLQAVFAARTRSAPGNVIPARLLSQAEEPHDRRRVPRRCRGVPVLSPVQLVDRRPQRPTAASNAAVSRNSAKPRLPSGSPAAARQTPA